MQENGAQRDVLLQQAVIQEEEDALLLLMRASVEERGVPEDLLGDRAGVRAEDVVLDRVEGVAAPAQDARPTLLEAASRGAPVPQHRE
eukprot:8653651-Alexandrium_andersonii.AAC.1